MTVHVVGCACFAALSWLAFLAQASGGRGTRLDLVLPLALLVLGLGVWVALAKRGNRRLAVFLVAAEAAVGIALWRAVSSSGLSDAWLYLAVLVIAGSGIGAASTANPIPRASASV